MCEQNNGVETYHLKNKKERYLKKAIPNRC